MITDMLSPDAHRWNIGDRFIADHVDRELGKTSRLTGVVLEVDELLAGARVRLDGSQHETWLALELLGVHDERRAA